jgi:hypothetical protein
MELSRESLRGEIKEYYLRQTSTDLYFGKTMVYFTRGESG